MLLVEVIKLSRHKIKNAGKSNLLEKTKRKIRNTWVTKLRNTNFYKYCYSSYWHLCLVCGHKMVNRNNMDLYFAARPNPGAGIRHQMANWILGYWFAKRFGIYFAYVPFS